MPITYTEKGAGLHDAIAAAGHMLTERDGVWLADDEAAVQAMIDAYDAHDTAALIVPEIKALARELIEARVPAWKQQNMTARAVDLVDGIVTGTLSADESTELAAIRAVWDWVKTIRAVSNQHEAALAALADAGDFAGVLAYDWRAGWPQGGA